jgi:hypothetical protein
MKGDPSILGPGKPMSDLHNDPAPEALRAGSSTGPRTPEGKAKSSQNSTTHGCCSNKAIIKGESQEEFEELLADWMDDYRPRSKSDRLLVEAAMLAQWVQMRNTNRYNELELELQEKSALTWTEEEHKKMERFTRYKTTAERSFVRSANTLEQAVKRRRTRVQEREDPSLRSGLRSSPEDSERVEEELPEVEAKPEAIHVLDQWADVLMEDGGTVTKLEPSNEQLLEDRGMMKPQPQQVCRRFHFRDGIPDEYSWCRESEEQRATRKWGLQQMTIETWLAAIEREQAAGTGHLSDTGEDLPDPQRRGCWCLVCARNTEISRRRVREAQGK